MVHGTGPSPVTSRKSPIALKAPPARPTQNGARLRWERAERYSVHSAKAMNATKIGKR